MRKLMHQLMILILMVAVPFQGYAVTQHGSVSPAPVVSPHDTVHMLTAAGNPCEQHQTQKSHAPGMKCGGACCYASVSGLATTIEPFVRIAARIESSDFKSAHFYHIPPSPLDRPPVHATS